MKRSRKIIKLKPNIQISEYEKEIQKQGGKIIEHLPLINALLCEFPVKKRGAVSVLENHPHVERVEDDLPVKITCIDPFFLFRPIQIPKQMKQEISWGIKMIEAESVLNVSPKNRVQVAVMDTGINPKHPDLRNNIKGGTNLTENTDDFSDPNGHGTHVAGIIGALNNDIGVVGVMPDIDIYAVKVFNSKGDGSLSDIVRGLQWCINNNIKLINMSFGSTEDNEAFREAFKNAEKVGLIMVAAAGNDQLTHKIQYPAKYQEVIAVSSLNEQGNISDFSSYGSEIDVIAPGEKIISTWKDGGYKTISGTSMAAPHVTGAIAQILSKWGDLSPVDVKKHLKATATRLQLKKEYQGDGLINVSRALKIKPPKILLYGRKVI